MIYVTSDLHGFPLEKFQELMESAGIGPSDTLYILGDVIDRNGDGGVGVLQWIVTQPNVRMLCGNHEQMLLENLFLFKETDFQFYMEKDDEERDRQQQLLGRWFYNGGRVTTEALKELWKRAPEEYASVIEYLEDLPLYAEVEQGGRKFVLTHAGLGHFEEKKELWEYDTEDLVWYRPMLDEIWFRDRMTVFGHTPTAYYDESYFGKCIRTETWIDIDTGAAAPDGCPMILRLGDLKEFYYR